MCAESAPVSSQPAALLKWAIGYALRRWTHLLPVIGAILLRVAIDVIRPWPMKLLVDNALYRRPLSAGLRHFLRVLPGPLTPQHLVAWAVAGTLVIFLLTRVTTGCSLLANMRFGRRLAFDLAEDLFTHLQRLSLRFHHRKAVGDSMRRVITDSTCISTLVRDGLLPVLTSALTLLTMLMIMWQLDRWLTLVALAVVPLLWLVLRRFSGPMVESSYDQQVVDGRMYATVEGFLSAMPVVQAFAREEEANHRFRQSADDSLRAALISTGVQVKFKFLVTLITGAGTAGLLWLGAHEVLTGRLTVGSLLVFLSYLACLYAPLESLVYTSSAIQSALGSTRRVLEILNAAPDVQERPDASRLPRARGEVRFEDVVFAYDANQPVLKKVSLAALPGETIAIVGPSGAGKSTLMSLIPRFYDLDSGRITLDGHNVRDLAIRDLRGQIAVVLQEPFLFPMTVAENIAYGRPDASQAQIEAAARAANAHEFICKLPEGYQTVVGERGATLSGGERQRISIARALLKDAPILILDEPTSAVDAQTEGLLVEALDRLMEGRTTFIIAHRLSTIRGADRIVVLQDGCVVEQGPHEALLARGGLYAKLASLQPAGEQS